MLLLQLQLIVAQDCSSSEGTKVAFKQYLDCIKTSLDSDYATFEKEIREHNKQAASTCFAPTIAAANVNERCVLAPSDLDSLAWDRNGPLRDCSICRTFAAGAIKAILSTPPEEQKCIRREVTKAVAKEADFCLRKKIANFAGVPEIPDLEESSYNFKENVIKSVSDYILVRSRLSFCAERKPSRAIATKNCLKNPFSGYLEKHCNVLRKCDQQITPACMPKMEEIRKGTCECIEETRDELKRRISGVIDNKDLRFFLLVFLFKRNLLVPAIGSGSKVDTCVASIKAHMVSDANDWVQVIDAALGRCIKNKPAGQSLGMDSLLNVGCRKVIADTTGTATTQLKTGFDFINNLIDAMVDRSGRFCGGPHCPQ
uniref:Saposin B-type domain-containing protein n=1 Tax=Syphacia muris TaxID=451379 RepID=A0A0N5AQZ1_9BILA